jgi:hypothetical protein
MTYENDEDKPPRKRRRENGRVHKTDFFSSDGVRVDLRSQRARRYKTIMSDLEYACNYPTTLWQRNLIRQVTATSVCIEELQRDILAGENVDLDAFTRLNGTLLRQYRLLGLKFSMHNGRVKRPLSFEEQIGGFATPPDTK